MATLPVLSTPRLKLLPWTPADVDALHQLWIGAEMRRYLWDDILISRERAAETVALSIESAERSGVGMWCVLPPGSERIIGFCGFRFIDDSPDIEILYGLHPDYCKQGLALEAASTALEYGFRTRLFDRVFGRTDVPNTSSARLLERLGMQVHSQATINGLPTLVYLLDKGPNLHR